MINNISDLKTYATDEIINQHEISRLYKRESTVKL